MPGQFSYLGITGFNAGTFTAAANNGSIRFYAGPVMTATTVNSAVNP